MARGLNFKDLKYILHCGVPSCIIFTESTNIYLHRVGRIRSKLESKSISLVLIDRIEIKTNWLRFSLRVTDSHEPDILFGQLLQKICFMSRLDGLSE